MSRLLDRRNAKRVNGLRRDPRTGAGKLAKSERGYGGVLAFDFTDNSAVVYDPTTQANVAYTQGVTDGNGNFRGVSSLLTYTSPSNKLTLQADGYIKYQAHNLCRYSETFQSWTASGAGTGATPTATNAFTTDDQGLSACRLQCDLQGGTSSGDISWFQGTTETPVSGAPYEITFRAKLNTGSSAVITIQQTGIGEVQRTITDVWSDYTVSAAATSTGATFYIGLRGARATANADTVDLLVSQLRFARTPANTDYIKTTSAAKYALPLEYDTSGNCLGLLVEEQRTNSALYSSVLDNAYWGVTNAVVASTSAQQPFLSGVYTLTPSTATSGVHRLIRSGPTNVITLGAAQSLVFSVYAKANGYTRIGLRESLTTGATCVFTLSGSGSAATPHSAGNITASNATIESVGNGWYRCAIVFTASSSTNTSPGVYVASPSYTSGDVESASWTPNGSDGVYVSQIDYCSGSFPTSPIITYGATATRAADNISIATSAFPHSTTATTMYLKAIPFVDDGGDVLLEKAAPNRADAMTQIYPSGSGLLSINDRGAAFATQATASEAITYDGVTSVKAAVSAQTNLFDFSINGSTETQDTSGTHQATAHTTVNIGTGTQSQGAGRVIVQQVLLLPRISTAAELIARTS